MNLLFTALVAAITVAVFARLIGCDFTAWDDPGTITVNPQLNPPSLAGVRFYWTTIGPDTPGQLFTPVTYTVWSALAAVAGGPPDADGFRLRPAYFHGANVLLHAAVATLVYQLLWRLLGRRWPAVAGGLLFSLHPVQVEAVGWASGTKDVLCGLFSVAAILAYVRAVQRASPGPGAVSDAGRCYARWPVRWRYLLATLLYLLAMLSKPTAIVVPLMAAAVDAFVLGRPWRTVARWLWLWALLMVPCALWTRATQPAPWASPVPVWTRPLVAVDAIAFYLCKIAWPARLCVDYGRRPTVVVASGAIYWTWLLPATVGVLLVWRWRRRALRERPEGVNHGNPQTRTGETETTRDMSHADAGTSIARQPSRLGPDALAGAAVLFALPLLPVSGLVPFDFQFYSTVADHYLYLPMVGVALTVAWALGRMRRGAAVVVGSVVVLAALVARSVAQMSTWRDTTTLFTNVLADNPRSFAAYDQLGGVQSTLARRIRAGRPTVPPADPQYRQWRADLERSLADYQASLRLYDGYVPSLFNIAVNAGQLGDHQQQRWALRQVVDLQPKLPAAMRVADPAELVHRLLAAGDPATAQRYLDAQLRDHPGDMRLLMLRVQAANAKAPDRHPELPAAPRSSSAHGASE